MSQNIGTLVTATLRPNDSLDKISIIFANEAKGGHHAYALYSDLTTAQANFPDRFIFGMLATVYGDTTLLNGTYVLSPKADSNTSNPLNWIQSVGGNDIDEWTNSVISITSSIPSIKNTGDRYLIIGSTGGTSLTYSENTWVGHEDNIAEYDSSVPTWNFTIPSEGYTVRVDNEKSILYKYTGSYSYGGRWVKEYINQVYNLTASSIDGINYTAIANLVGYYKPSVFYINFLTASVGAYATININNLGTASIKKVVGNTLLDIAANDFNTSVMYQLVYDGTYFQTPMASSANVIGPAEFGNTYSNGLFSDFTTSTPTGVPVDRFNQILAALVPPSAPNLSAINGLSSLNLSGKLSFPYSAISALNNYNAATGSAYGNIGIDTQWISLTTAENIGFRRLGIFAATSSNTDKNVNISGVLNYNVATNSATPTPAYVGNSFGNGYSGNLYLNINGLTVSTISLTSSYSQIDTTSNGTVPGLSVSAATSSKFPGGAAFNLFYNRTGTWLIPRTSMYGPFTYNSSLGLTANSYGLTRGYNYVTVTQVTPTTTYALSKVEFILDDNVTNPTVTNPWSGAFNYVTFSNIKYLSGIGFYSNLVQLQYQVNLNNIYGGVYSDLSNAIQLQDLTPTGSGSPKPTITSVSQAIPALNGNFGYYTAYTLTQNLSIPGSYRRINDTIAINTSVIYKPLITGNFVSFNSSNGGSASLTGVMFDNVAASSTINSLTQVEYFDDEQYRLQYQGGTYDTYGIISAYPFTSSTSLLADTNSLQVINGKLQYPLTDYSFATSTTNPNAGIASAVYSSATGVRYYIRQFRYTSSFTSQFTIAIQGSGTLTASTANFASLSNTNNFAIQIKLPGASSAHTGWLDISRPFNSPFSGVDNLGIQSGGTVNLNNTPFGLNIGTFNTVNSSGYVLLRVTAPSKWTGSIDTISFTFQ